VIVDWIFFFCYFLSQSWTCQRLETTLIFMYC